MATKQSVPINNKSNLRIIMIEPTPYPSGGGDLIEFNPLKLTPTIFNPLQPKIIIYLSIIPTEWPSIRNILFSSF